MSTPLDEALEAPFHADDSNLAARSESDTGETPTPTALAPVAPGVEPDQSEAHSASSRVRRFAPKRSRSVKPTDDRLAVSPAEAFVTPAVAGDHSQTIADEVGSGVSAVAARLDARQADRHVPDAAPQVASGNIPGHATTQHALVDPGVVQTPARTTRPSRSRSRQPRAGAAAVHATLPDVSAPARPEVQLSAEHSQAASATIELLRDPRPETADIAGGAHAPSLAVSVEPAAVHGEVTSTLATDSEQGATDAALTSAKRPPRRRSRARGSRKAGSVVPNESAPVEAPEAEPPAPSTDLLADDALSEQIGVSTASNLDVTTTDQAEPRVLDKQASTRPPRSRRPRRRTPSGASQPATPTSNVGQDDAVVVDSAASGDFIASAEATLEEPFFLTAPGGEVDGAEALARSLLDMFPPIEEIQAVVDGETGLEQALPHELDGLDEAVESESIPGDDVPTSSAISSDVEEDSGSDAARRRGRRGRRGGRGRRRGALHVIPDTETATEPADAPLAAEALVPRPEAPIQNYADLFTPDVSGRIERPWRERGPQRRWGRTFPRSAQSIAMPPPKPSQTGRFAPIPQAVAPSLISQPVQPLVARAAPLIELPSLRTDEPLAPGESRTERLLDIQNQLLRAMIEGQSRQIESLTANVDALHQAVRDLAAGAGARAFKPKTAIFVDAPNVCYAAANARVNLDFGRMLKYLSRDRHLVHALSYSPIIDDVREGIRYETQRFVAPFLRTGYKLITKPLKRFSDGSAKGNFDLELALDILTMAERLDVVVLVSGDSDFECVIEHIQQRGVRVEVVAFASNVSTELVNIADSFIDIMQHVEHFKAL